MKLARVAGTVVATFCAPVFADKRLLLCDYLSPDGEATGDYVLAVDVVEAGPGELVLIMDEGTGARQILGEKVAPVRAMIVGIVDEVDA